MLVVKVRAEQSEGWNSAGTVSSYFLFYFPSSLFQVRRYCWRNENRVAGVFLTNDLLGNFEMDLLSLRCASKNFLIQFIGMGFTRHVSRFENYLT